MIRSRLLSACALAMATVQATASDVPPSNGSQPRAPETRVAQAEASKSADGGDAKSAALPAAEPAAIAGSTASAAPAAWEGDGAPGSTAGFVGGASLYLLRPNINNNVAFTTTTGIGSTSTSANSQSFDWGYRVAPSVWIGWVGESGVGFRTRYFHFDQESNSVDGTLGVGDAATTVVTPPSGLSPSTGLPPRGFQSPGILLESLQGQDTLRATSDLRIQTLDGEATYSGDAGSYYWLLSVGGRYLQMNQNYLATLTNVVNPSTQEQSSLSAGHNFYGGGPTLAAQLGWRLWESGLSVVGSARGSYLVGNTRNSVSFAENITDPVNGNQNNLSTSNGSATATLPVLELEGGLEYSRVFRGGRLFVRGSLVNQTYFDSGSASSLDGNLSLFGALVSIGLDR